MKKLGAILLLSVLYGILFACQSKHTGIEALEVWARVANRGGNSAVYMVLRNHSNQVDELIGASSDIAQVIELHKSEINQQGVMTMQKQYAIFVPANSVIQLQPGGYHIMLLGLKRNLKEGDTFEIVLNFKSHADLPLRVSVRGVGMEMQPQEADDHGSGSHDHPMSSPTP